MASWRNGRRSGFKIRRWQQCPSSSLGGATTSHQSSMSKFSSKYFFILFLIFFSFDSFSQSPSVSSAAELIKSCSKKDLLACEKLNLLYIQKEEWENAYLLGKALCEKEVVMGCTFQGMAALSQKKSQEGMKILTHSCDKFEPYACRSLGRLMKTAGKADLSHVYFRKACHFGIKEICKDLQKSRKVLSQSGLKLLKKVQSDCNDTKSSLCTDRLSLINNCHTHLSINDCEVLPSLLTIFFRSKLIQSEARLILIQIASLEKSFKEKSIEKKYSFALTTLFKEITPKDNYRYIFGFAKSCSSETSFTSFDLYPDSYKNLSPQMISVIKKEFSKAKKSDCYNPHWGFEAFAMANLDPIHPDLLDIWKINHDGNVIHLQDGQPIQQ
jgi:hypothetical protein